MIPTSTKLTEAHVARPASVLAAKGVKKMLGG
jgi:hypothetical protein